MRVQLLCERDDDTGEICNVVEVIPDSPFRLQLPTKVTRQAIVLLVTKSKPQVESSSSGAVAAAAVV